MASILAPTGLSLIAAIAAVTPVAAQQDPLAVTLIRWPYT